MEDKMFSKGTAMGIMDILKEYLSECADEITPEKRKAMGSLLSEARFSLEDNDVVPVDPHYLKPVD